MTPEIDTLVHVRKAWKEVKRGCIGERREDSWICLGIQEEEMPQ